MAINGRMIVLLVTVLLISACSELGILPTSSRSGKVYEILIMEEGPQPVDLVVGIGDEVRFRNERTKPSYVLFFRDFRDEMACERGFKMLWGTEEQAKIEPGDSASLCFNRTGTVGYKVQFDYTDFGGIGGTPGEINVPPGHPGAIIVKE